MVAVLHRSPTQGHQRELTRTLVVKGSTNSSSTLTTSTHTPTSQQTPDPTTSLRSWSTSTLLLVIMACIRQTKLSRDPHAALEATIPTEEPSTSLRVEEPHEKIPGGAEAGINLGTLMNRGHDLGQDRVAQTQDLLRRGAAVARLVRCRPCPGL
jgi:hypothetical protein